MIYGESRCRTFARKWITAAGGQPNRKVVSNGEYNYSNTHSFRETDLSIADNYSWFFLYHWFDTKWSWHTVPHDELKKAKVQNEQDTVVPGTEPAFEDPDIGMLLDESPRNENDVQTSDAIPENCRVDENSMDENGIPAITCQYIGGDEDWDLPFQSDGGCELS